MIVSNCLTFMASSTTNGTGRSRTCIKNIKGHLRLGLKMITFALFIRSGEDVAGNIRHSLVRVTDASRSPNFKCFKAFLYEIWPAMWPQDLFGVVSSWKQSSSFLVQRWDRGELGGDWTIPQASAQPRAKNGPWAWVTLLLFITRSYLHPPLLRRSIGCVPSEHTGFCPSPCSSYLFFYMFAAHPLLCVAKLWADQG